MNNLKEARLKNKLSQDELAFITGYTQSYISSIESGKKLPSYNAAFKISKALGVTVEYLFMADEGKIIQKKAKLIASRKGGEAVC